MELKAVLGENTSHKKLSKFYITELCPNVLHFMDELSPLSPPVISHSCGVAHLKSSPLLGDNHLGAKFCMRRDDPRLISDSKNKYFKHYTCIVT